MQIFMYPVRAMVSVYMYGLYSVSQGWTRSWVDALERDSSGPACLHNIIEARQNVCRLLRAKGEESEKVALSPIIARHDMSALTAADVLWTKIICIVIPSSMFIILLYMYCYIVLDRVTIL